MDCYLGQVMSVAFPFAPSGWALCDGQLLQIAMNAPLFALIGTRFGGDGLTTFGLPDLRGRVVVGLSGQPGAIGGTEAVALVADQLPQHSHSLNASQLAATPSRTPLPAAGNIFGAGATQNVSLYDPPVGAVTLSAGNVLATGDGVPHNNMQPFLAVNYIIALQGMFPRP